MYRKKKLGWLLAGIFLVGITTILLYNTRFVASHRNRFQLDLDEYYNEDYYLYEIEDETDLGI